MKIILTILSIAFQFAVFSQSAATILSNVISKFNTVKDYSVSVNVKANIPMIKILPSKATVYFKQKDKFKVVSKGIVILPKQGFTEINTFLADKKSYMAVEGDSAKVGGVNTHQITVIPNGESNEIVLAKLWIDSKRSVIMKSQITTKSNGTVTTVYSYGDKVNFGLPSQLVFEIDVKKFKLPKSVASDINKTTTEKPTKTKNKGSITISLTDYKVNTGLSDAVFKKEK
jgi:outer membrane lipoprotein-sorting protein